VEPFVRDASVGVDARDDDGIRVDGDGKDDDAVGGSRR